MPRLLDEVMEANAHFLASGIDIRRNYTPSPRRQVAIFTCMDTRLVKWLEPAMGINRGDAHIIKNAGNTILNERGAVIRSLVVSVFALGVREIFVVGHLDCGMAKLPLDQLEQAMIERGVPAEAISEVEDLDDWVGSFADPVENVRRVTRVIRESPLIPDDVPVHGLIIEPNRGELDLLVNGYERVTIRT